MRESPIGVDLQYAIELKHCLIKRLKRTQNYWIIGVKMPTKLCRAVRGKRVFQAKTLKKLGEVSPKKSYFNAVKPRVLLTLNSWWLLACLSKRGRTPHNNVYTRCRDFSFSDSTQVRGDYISILALSFNVRHQCVYERRYARVAHWSRFAVRNRTETLPD